MSALERQVGGDHYKGYAIQPIEFFIKNNIPFTQADIIKRILRFDKPTGKGKEDLLKIKHEIDLLLELHAAFNDKKELSEAEKTMLELANQHAKPRK